ncbi:MAG: hypothetical protein UT50_C0006G0012 [Candidatus Moranbacteria bacterium GW2011_GWA2_39_41]|nr:MAG: hypothetical protein UT50_C0006G0012 [Candidatus Moranbacteria bacterium GW2011_GWA2_39_41]
MLIRIISVILAVTVLAGSGFFAYQKFSKKESVVAVMPVEKNYFEINDETSGVFFRVSKNFDRMTAQELQVKNPAFMYGFTTKSDKTAYCVISQTKRDKPGGVKATDLRDGVLAQVKKSFPDTSLESASVVEVGDQNNGIKIVMNYTDNKMPTAQQEVVGITDKTATFAFCMSPKAVLDLYQDDFNLFLNSLKIK